MERRTPPRIFPILRRRKATRREMGSESLLHLHPRHLLGLIKLSSIRK
jgi:hypothetical protein